MSNKLGLPEQNIELQRNTWETNQLNSTLTTEQVTSIVSANPDDLDDLDDIKEGELVENQDTFWAIVSLSAALLAVSLAAIFIRLSEREIGQCYCF